MKVIALTRQHNILIIILRIIIQMQILIIPSKVIINIMNLDGIINLDRKDPEYLSC